MNYNSTIKRIDNLGRIVLPKDIRKKLKLNENDEVEIIPADSNSVIIKKYSALEEYGTDCIEYIKLLEEITQARVVITDKTNIITSTDEKSYNIKVTNRYKQVLEDRKVISEKIMPMFNIVENGTIYAKAIAPIISDSTVLGGIVIYYEDKNKAIKDKDIELLKYTAKILANKI